MTRNWIFRPEPEAAAPPFAAWAERLEVSELIVRLLWRRGVGSVDDMALYLSPNLRHLAPLDEWPGLEQAAVTRATEATSPGSAARLRRMAISCLY